MKCRFLPWPLHSLQLLCEGSALQPEWAILLQSLFSKEANVDPHWKGYILLPFLNKTTALFLQGWPFSFNTCVKVNMLVFRGVNDTQEFVRGGCSRSAKEKAAVCRCLVTEPSNRISTCMSVLGRTPRSMQPHCLEPSNLEDSHIKEKKITPQLAHQ